MTIKIYQAFLLRKLCWLCLLFVIVVDIARQMFHRHGWYLLSLKLTVNTEANARTVFCFNQSSHLRHYSLIPTPFLWMEWTGLRHHVFHWVLPTFVHQPAKVAYRKIRLCSSILRSWTDSQLGIQTQSTWRRVMSNSGSSVRAWPGSEAPRKDPAKLLKDLRFGRWYHRSSQRVAIYRPAASSGFLQGWEFFQQSIFDTSYGGKKLFYLLPESYWLAPSEDIMWGAEGVTAIDRPFWSFAAPSILQFHAISTPSLSSESGSTKSGYL